MTKAYTHTLAASEIEHELTLDDVAAQLPRRAFIDNGQAVVLLKDVGSALVSSTARCVFAGSPASFARVE
ncbi:hypothetical protein [Glutamicibacter creatinolyticus]|uniref:hypothetical protein n=1 Tax=Glutamicibacter creatinolyticus TaxID=162496 RepID=UPI001110854E|nr:hypothetical protein [Glutamicibacter creatinolyticus]